MPRRDPLEVLARLGGIARDRATQALAEAEGVRAVALTARDAAEAALHTEAAAAPADYAAWLPAARQRREETGVALRRAEAGSEVARAALVAARAEAEAMAMLLAERRSARRRAALAAEQRLLDDLPR